MSKLNFNPDEFPFGVAPGANKYHLHKCPFCGDTGKETGDSLRPFAFLFRDLLSATEYTISGLCQTCQDKTFGEPNE